MPKTDTEISDIIKAFIIENYFDGPPEELTNEVPLISSGIIDSVSILKVVVFLESNFNFEFESHEIDEEYLDTINLMIILINSKKQ